MRYIADLHTHSTASDGQYSPSALIELATEKGIKVLALTDHDTVDGIGEAVEVGKRLGVRIIPGIELSAREYDTFHILGYGVNPSDSGLCALCEERKTMRDKRSELIVQYLVEKGMHLTLEEVEFVAGSTVIGRPHFARVMLEKGYISDIRQAFDCYLDTEEYQRIERFKADARTCIRAIKDSGGKVSMAHPYQLGMDNDALETLVKQLKDHGLDALECHYPKHTPEQTTFYFELAKKYDLHISGGSDFHGEMVKPDVKLAQVELDLDWLLG